MRRLILAAVSLAALIAAAVPNFADNQPPADKKAGDQPSNDEMMKKMMEEYGKLASPGEFHKNLEPFVGKWTVEGRFHMAPEAPWSSSKSESEIEWILGGRFLLQRVKGEPMMAGSPPFEGIGLLGYDNALKKYVSTWADNMGTMLMNADGACDATGKIITLKSIFMDPTTNKETWMKTVYKSESKDKFTLKLCSPDESGREFICMELTYKRK